MVFVLYFVFELNKFWSRVLKEIWQLYLKLTVVRPSAVRRVLQPPGNV